MPSTNETMVILGTLAVLALLFLGLRVPHESRSEDPEDPQPPEQKATPEQPQQPTQSKDDTAICKWCGSPCKRATYFDKPIGLFVCQSLDCHGYTFPG